MVMEHEVRWALGYWIHLCFWNKNTEEWLWSLFCAAGYNFSGARASGGELVTTFVPSPSATCGPFSRGQVGVVIGEGAHSGISVRALPSIPGHSGIQGAGVSGVSVALLVGC